MNLRLENAVFVFLNIVYRYKLIFQIWVMKILQISKFMNGPRAAEAATTIVTKEFLPPRARRIYTRKTCFFSATRFFS